RSAVALARRASGGGFRNLWHRLFRSGRVHAARKQREKNSAPARMAAAEDASAQALEDSSAFSQSDALVAGAFGGRAGFEQALHDLCRHPAAGIADLQQDEKLSAEV